MATDCGADIGDELLNCTICFEKFTTPKTLQCLHTFCEPCLRRHLAAYISHRQDLIHPIKIPCPTCRELTPLPDNGISGLRTDFKISKITDLLSKVTQNNEEINNPISCSICKTVNRYIMATFHCKDCSKYFCDDCIFRHQNTELFDSHYARELRSEKKNKSLCTDHDNELLRYFCQSCNIQICTLCSMTEHMMHNLTDLDQGKARQQRAKKIKALMHKVDAKVNQMVIFERKLEKLEDSLLVSYNQTSAMIERRAAEIIRQVKGDEEELIDKLQKQYEGKLSNLLSERQSVDDFKEKLIGLKTLAEETLEKDDGEPFLEVSCDLIRALKQATQVQFLNPDDFKEVESEFQLTFSPEMPRLGQLSDMNISANLSFISRIPVHLVAKLDDKKLDQPSDVRFTQDGKIIIADTENYQLKLYSKEGQLLQTMAVGEVKPAGLEVTRVRTIAVTDVLDKCVKIFGEHGQLLFEFGRDLFAWPAGICMNNYGEYIVSDVGHHAITIHDSQGNLLARLGSYGSGDTNFDCPYYVTTNEDNDIIVSDMGNHCVKVFNYNLDLITKIDDPDNLVCPSGVAVDLQGHILVCDSSTDSVLMYTADGQLIACVLTEDDGIVGPQGLCVANSGEMVVTMCDNRKGPRHEARIYQLYD